MQTTRLTFFAMIIVGFGLAILPDVRSILPPIQTMDLRDFLVLFYSYVLQALFTVGLGILLLVRPLRASSMNSTREILTIEDAARRVV
ncbi:hypothetical protein [Brucella intermedia]|uniref:hypothetical protein n=1 Tax=Brucella intermedia TaxID=94625 RepID=UPI00224A98D0|nr:hypothetical protein [Brucella intermedia]